MPISNSQLPERLNQDLTLFLEFLFHVLAEHDEKVVGIFTKLLWSMNAAAEEQDETVRAELFSMAYDLVASLPPQQLNLLVRALAAYYHLATICEEDYLVELITKLEDQTIDGFEMPTNVLFSAYQRVSEVCGQGEAVRLLKRLEFHPVFTAHPTEARRPSIEAKITQLTKQFHEYTRLTGINKVLKERHMMENIDAMLRTSPVGILRPTPVKEADKLISIFDNTLFDLVSNVYQRLNDLIMGEDAATNPPVTPAFIKPGSWIASDRDGNPNVTAKVTCEVAEELRVHVLERYATECGRVGYLLTFENQTTPPSLELKRLWHRMEEMGEKLTAPMSELVHNEFHRAVMYAISSRVRATIERSADYMYGTSEELVSDLRMVQSSLAEAGAAREAYGPVQRLIWRVETFGFGMVEMEIRQHSVVHARALEDLRQNGPEGQLQPMTKEVLATLRAMSFIQRRNGRDAARRYIVSFTQSARDIAAVYELAHYAFPNAEELPNIDVIPLFEQLNDLENAVNVLDGMLEIPDVQTRLEATGRRMEVMLGYSDSSKDAGPTSATLALHRAQAKIAAWAQEHQIDLVLFHGRGGAVGRGGGPAERSVLAQPAGTVNGNLKLTEQGEVIFEHYHNSFLARHHVEAMAAAALLASSSLTGNLNDELTTEFADVAEAIDIPSCESYRKLMYSEGFAEWFAQITPLDEIGLLPIGSRPSKRGLGAKSLDDLRSIPWIFAWSQARINLAAWYGLGSACEAFGDIARLREAYAHWPLFTTFIDNVETTLAKTDASIAQMYLSLGDRPDLTERALAELELTKRWVLDIVESDHPLAHNKELREFLNRHLPLVNVMSLGQIFAMRKLRKHAGELTEEEREGYIYLLLCTVTGISAGVQNTG